MLRYLEATRANWQKSEVVMEVTSRNQHRCEPGGDSVTMLSSIAAAMEARGLRLFKG